MIDGVETRVLWERDVNEGVLRETEIAFFAQDDDGNVWNLGEYPEEYEGRTFLGAPSTWISGHDDAEGGIHVQGDPQVGTPPYVAGQARKIDFLDYAQVSQLGAEACSWLGCYDDVLVVDEWDPLAQPADGHQLKNYAPGVGPVRVDPLGGEEQETLELVEVNQLDAAALDEVRTRHCDSTPGPTRSCQPCGASRRRPSRSLIAVPRGAEAPGSQHGQVVGRAATPGRWTPRVAASRLAVPPARRRSSPGQVRRDHPVTPTGPSSR